MVHIVLGRLGEDGDRTAFLLLLLEAIFGDFYVTVSRSVTPIFLVASGLAFT